MLFISAISFMCASAAFASRSCALQFTFQYCNAKPYASKAALVKMKDESGTDTYWMVLMLNNLVMYKGKSEPTAEAYHTKVFNLVHGIDALGVRSHAVSVCV